MYLHPHLVRPRHHRYEILEQEVEVSLRHGAGGGPVREDEERVAGLGEAARQPHQPAAHQVLAVRQVDLTGTSTTVWVTERLTTCGMGAWLYSGSGGAGPECRLVREEEREAGREAEREGGRRWERASWGVARPPSPPRPLYIPADTTMRHRKTN